MSPLTFAGAPRGAAGRTAGAALALARKAKERTYPELRHSARCKLVVLALELGGRWSPEAATFVKLLARLRARAVPPASRGPSIAAFASRWSTLLSFAAARAFVASLREQAEEGGSFGVPAAANLKPKHDQAAPPAAVNQFACACAGQLLYAQQRLAGSLCRGAVCRPEKGG